MRVLTVLATRPAGGQLADGSPAPALPLRQSVPLAHVAAVTLSVQQDPQDMTKVLAQALSVQVMGGGAIAIARNRAPANAAHQARILQIHDQLLAELKDDAVNAIELTYEELI